MKKLISQAAKLHSALCKMQGTQESDRLETLIRRAFERKIRRESKLKPIPRSICAAYITGTGVIRYTTTQENGELPADFKAWCNH